MTDEHSPQPLTETELDNQVVRSVAEEVKRYGKWASRIEVMLVAVAALAFVIAAVFGAVSFARLKELAEANRQRAIDAEAGQQFAINAVNCIRYVMIEHIYVNQQYHDLLIGHFGLPLVALPHDPDFPRRPSAEEISEACKAFEGIPPPSPEPPQIATSTTRGKG
jgi:hypothetical protein